MNILFILDPFEKLIPSEDTTLIVMSEASKRGHIVWACHSDELLIEDGVAVAYARKTTVKANDKVTWSEGETEKVALDKMQVIFMRTNPPFNSSYLTATYILSRVDETKTLIVNRPEALRNYNEKLLVFEFPQFCAPTLITVRKSDIREFVEKHDTAVIKPLYDFGGHGICVLNKNDKNITSIAEMVTKNFTESVVLQKYIPEAEKGDIRAVALNGKIIGYESRIRSSSEYRNNISSGGHLERANLTKSQKIMAEQVAARLPSLGIFFAGIDIIGDYITEINITSPTGIATINKLENIHLEPLVVDFFESYEKFLTR